MADKLLADMEHSGLSGTGFVDLRAKVHGLRGTILFALKRFAESKEATNLALQDCIAEDDQEGIRIYRQNLSMLETHAPDRPELLNVEIDVLEVFAKARRLPMCIAIKSVTQS